LKTVGINVEKVHPEFGDVKKLLTKEFVQKKYLEVSVISIGNDQTALEFRWGQRAKEETTKKEVLDFVCTIYGSRNSEGNWVNMEERKWTSQMQDAERDERRRQKAASNSS